MLNVFRIYKRDLKKIITNPVAIIIILALCALPALYAWPNIKACWDPYGNTKGIKVAVVNQDKGASVEGHSLNLGDEITDKLKNNDKIGWVFVDEKDAEYGLNHNKYYAYIMIPDNFSENISTLTTKNPVKPELIYKVNEKANAISPKITDAGTRELIKEITANFVDTVNKAIFESFNTIGNKLNDNKENLINLKDAIISINNNMGNIETSINKAHNGAIDLKDFLAKLENNVPLVNDSISKLETAAESTNKLISQTKTNLNSMADSLKFKLQEIKTINDDVLSLVKNLKDLSESSAESKEKINKVLDLINTKLDTINSKITSSLTVLQALQEKLPNNTAIKNQIATLQSIQSSIVKNQEKIKLIKEALASGQKISSETLTFVENTVIEAQAKIDEKITSFEANIRPAVNEIANNLIGATNNTQEMLNNVKSLVPKLQNLITLGKEGSESGITLTNKIQDILPTIKSALNTASEDLSKINDDDLNKLVDILLSNPELMANYISNPVELKQDNVFHIPNYGSAMSPFYTILSLWVGALLLCSLIKTEVNKFEDGYEAKPLEQYFGRFLTFLTITLIQSLIVSLGDKYILGTYVYDLKLFVLFSVYSSFIFTIIVYTLTSVLGNVGKAVSIVLLVLQVAGSGGTFPIQVTPEFFQKLQPFLPFTYAIGATREAVAGPIWSNITYDLSCLTIFGVVFLVLGTLLKTPLSSPLEKINHKFKESGLAE
ncbi:MAG: YhgE/Pip family protein [Sarcina sp.]